MNSNSLKEWGIILFVAFVISIVPLAINLYDKSIEREAFYEYRNENYQSCVKKAKAKSMDDYLCREIRKSSTLAFRSATDSSEHSILFITIFTVITILLVSLRRQKMKDEGQNK